MISLKICCRFVLFTDIPAAISCCVICTVEPFTGSPAMSSAFSTFMSVATLVNKGLKVRALPLFFTSKVIFFPISIFMFRSTLAFSTRSSESLICTSLPFLAMISPLMVWPGTRERICLLMLSIWAGVICVWEGCEEVSVRTSPEKSCDSFIQTLLSTHDLF